MKALVINCTPKRSPEPPDTEAQARVVAGRSAEHDVKAEVVRPVGLAMAPGMVTGDGGPSVGDRLLGRTTTDDLSGVAHALSARPLSGSG